MFIIYNIKNKTYNEIRELLQEVNPRITGFSFSKDANRLICFCKARKW